MYNLKLIWEFIFDGAAYQTLKIPGLMAGEGNMALHAHGAGLGEGGAAVNDELGAGEIAGLVAG